MSTTISISKNTFGYIYKKALKTQLQQIGAKFRSLRESRNESIERVEDLTGLLPGELRKIEKGWRDFRLQELIDLCKYYNVEVETIIKESGLMQLNFVHD